MSTRKRQKSFRSSGRREQDSNSKSKSRRRSRSTPTRQRASASPPREYQEGALPDLIRPQKHITVTSGHSDEVIGDVFTALYDETTQQTVSFDEAITLIRERENIASDEELLYIGRGAFAVVAYEGEEKDRHQVIKRKIDFEQHPEELAWRESLRFDISLAGTPPVDVHDADRPETDRAETDQDDTDQDEIRDDADRPEADRPEADQDDTDHDDTDQDETRADADRAETDHDEIRDDADRPEADRAEADQDDTDHDETRADADRPEADRPEADQDDTDIHSTSPNSS